MKRIIFFVGIIVFISCNKQNAGNENLKKLDDLDIQRIREAYSLVLYYNNIAQIAQMKATSNEIKELAQKSMMAYKQISNDLVTMASKKVISLPNDISEKQKADIQNLLKEEGVSFDKKMVSEIKDSDKNALALYQDLYVKSQDDEISYWALNKLSGLRDNLYYADVLHQKLKIK